MITFNFSHEALKDFPSGLPFEGSQFGTGIIGELPAQDRDTDGIAYCVYFDDLKVGVSKAMPEIIEPGQVIMAINLATAAITEYGTAVQSIEPLGIVIE
jgi:hypothetical protein